MRRGVQAVRVTVWGYVFLSLGLCPLFAAPQPQPLSRFSATTFNPNGEIVEFINFSGNPQEYFIVDPALENPQDPNFGAIKVGAVLTRGVLVTRDNRPAPPPPNAAGQSGFRDRPGASGDTFVPTGFNLGRVFASYNPDAYGGEGAYFLAMDISAPAAMDSLSGTQPIAFDVDGNGNRFTQTEIAVPGTVSEAPKADEDRYSISIDTNADGLPEIKVNIIERRSAIRVGGILIDPGGVPQMIDGVLVRRSVLFEDRSGTLPGDAKSQAITFLDSNDDGLVNHNDFGIGADIELAIRNVRSLPRIVNPDCVSFAFTADTFDDEPLGGGAEELVRLTAVFPVPDIEARKKVRCAGSGEFSTQAHAAPGSEVEFEITVENRGNVDLDVSITDLPACLGSATLTPVPASCQVGIAPQGFVSPEFCADFHAALNSPGGFPLPLGRFRAAQMCGLGLGERLVFTYRAVVGPTGFNSSFCDNEIDCSDGVSVTGTTSLPIDGILPPFSPSEDSPDGNAEEEDCRTAACCNGIPGCVPNDGIGDVRDEFHATVSDLAAVIDTERERMGTGDDNVATVEVECRGITLTKEVRLLPDGRFLTGLEALQVPSAPVDLEYHYKVTNNGESAETITIEEGFVCDDIAALIASFAGQVQFLACPICTGPTPGRFTGPAAANGGMLETSCGIRFTATGEPALQAYMRADDGRPACRATTPQGGADDSCYRNCAGAGALISSPTGVCAGGEIRSESMATVCHQVCTLAVTKKAQCLDDCTRRNPIGTLQDVLSATPDSCLRFQVNVTNSSTEDPICRLRITDLLSHQPANILFDDSVSFKVGATVCSVPAGFNTSGVPFVFNPTTDCGMPGGLAPGQTLTYAFNAKVPIGANHDISPENDVTVDGASFCPAAGPSFTCSGMADAVVDILQPALACTDKLWEIQPDTDGDCDPDGPFRPGGDVPDLGGDLFPALLRFRLRASNPGDVTINATASDNVMSNCVANTPGVSFASPPVCELGVSKLIAPGGMAEWVCQILVDSADAMRELTRCDGTDDGIFRNSPSISGSLVAGGTPLCVEGSLDIECEGELDTPVLGPPDCEMTVRKQVKCATDPDSAYADAIAVLPNTTQTFRIEVRNDSKEVRIPQVCLTDMLGCDDLLVAGTVSARLGASDVTACFGPAFQNSLHSGVRGCYSLAACRPAAPWIAPQETLTITFNVAVLPGFTEIGINPDCINAVRVEGYENACDDNPPAQDACVVGTDSAEFDVRLPRIACDKGVCPDLDRDGQCDRNFQSELLLPETTEVPFSILYRVTITNTGEVPLENVKACDDSLAADAIAAGIALVGCQLNGASGCSVPATLAPTHSLTAICRLWVPTRVAWLNFAGRDSDSDPDCYSNSAIGSGLTDTDAVCGGGTPLPVESPGCSARACLPPPPRGACCRFDGTCRVSIEEECTDVGSTYLGNNTECRGDENGNGIDDACEEPIPTVSEWGLVILALLFLTAGKLYIRRPGGDPSYS